MESNSHLFLTLTIGLIDKSEPTFFSCSMRLKREPRVPTKWELAANAEKMVPKKVHSTWKPFLGMHMIPEEERDEERAFFDDIEESF